MRAINTVLVALGLLLVMQVMQVMQAQAAVDCSRATGNIDRLLCSNSRAAQAEERMAYAFRAAVQRGIPPGQLRSTQLKWQEEVRNRCNDVDCLVDAYDRRADELDSLVAQ